MFKLRNPFGNVQKIAETEHKRDNLLAQGYILETAPVKTVKEMTVPELKAYAEANNIDLTGADRKDDILARILEAESSGSGA